MTPPEDFTSPPDAPATILVISTDPDFGRDWVDLLTKAGHTASLVELGDPALTAINTLTPDLCLIACQAGHEAALDCCRQLREASAIPLALFTTRADEAYLLDAYAAGLDGVVPLPISPPLFLAMLRAWLGRARALPAAFATGLRVGGFTLYHTQRRLVNPAGEVVKLTALEARLLYVLMRRPGQPIDAPRLVRWVWGYDAGGDHSALKNLVYRLRRKIEPEPRAPRVLVRAGHTGYSFLGDLTERKD